MLRLKAKYMGHKVWLIHCPTCTRTETRYGSVACVYYWADSHIRLNHQVIWNKETGRYM